MADPKAYNFGRPINMDGNEIRNAKLISPIIEGQQQNNSTPAYSNGLVYGSVVWSGTGLVFNVSACKYYIAGVEYNILPQQVTLSPADATNTRIDVIYVNASSVAGKLSGVASSDPAKPMVDPYTQIELTSVIVAANATTPESITTTIIYNDNTEWTHTVSEGTADFAFATLPYSGTKCIKATRALLSQNLEVSLNLTGTAINTPGATLTFRVKFSNASSLETFFAIAIGLNAASSLIWISKNKTYGLDFTSTSWQTVTIPLSDFAGISPTFNYLNIKGVFVDEPAVYFDKIEVQSSAENNVYSSGIFGNSSLVAQITLDGTGKVIHAENVPIAVPLDVIWALPTYDLAANGPKAQLKAGGDLTFGMACTMNTDGEMENAAGDIVVGIALETIANNGTGFFALHGCFIRNDAWTLTPGVPMYFDSNTFEITQTLVNGHYYKRIGVATRSNVLYFIPEFTEFLYTI